MVQQAGGLLGGLDWIGGRGEDVEHAGNGDLEVDLGVCGRGQESGGGGVGGGGSSAEELKRGEGGWGRDRLGVFCSGGGGGEGRRGRGERQGWRELHT